MNIAVVAAVGIALVACSTAQPIADSAEAPDGWNEISQAVGSERVALDEARDLLLGSAATLAACMTSNCPSNASLSCGSPSAFAACGGAFCSAGCLNTPHCTTNCLCSQRPAQKYQALTGCTWFLDGKSGQCTLVTTQTVQQNSCGCGGIHEC